jgi:GntR family transcriptional regulator
MNTSNISRSKPLAKQVYQLLLERIHSNVYSPDHRMPSEDRLAEELQVSRTTVRAALDVLTAEGYVLRRHGDGTYVNPHIFELNVHTIPVWDILVQIEETGRQPSLLVLEGIKRQADPTEGATLKLNPNEEVFVTRRLFKADQRPVALVTTIVRCNGLSPQIPAEAASLPPNEFLKRYHQEQIGSGQIRFKAIQADPETAHLFQVTPSTPMLLMDAILFDKDDHPLGLSQEIYLGSEGFGMKSSVR